MDQVLQDQVLPQEREPRISQMTWLQTGQEPRPVIMFEALNLVPPLMAQECLLDHLKCPGQAQVSIPMHLDGTGLVTNQKKHSPLLGQPLLESHLSLVPLAPFPVMALKKNQILALTGQDPNHQTKFLVQIALHLVSPQDQEDQMDYLVIPHLVMSPIQVGTGHATSQEKILVALVPLVHLMAQV